MPTSPIHAVLFDFDGVIADTANLHVAAWERTFAAMGWDVPTEVTARAASEDDRAFLKDVFSSRGIQNGDLEGWLRRKQELTRSLLRFAPRIYPGVEPLLRALNKHAIPVGIVTGTWLENVATALEAGGIANLVQICVTKDDIESLKPNPQGYLLACEKLQVEPAQAMAVEDSLSGVEAATRAGLKVLAVGHRHPEGPWTLNASYIADLRNDRTVLNYLGLSE